MDQAPWVLVRQKVFRLGQLAGRRDWLSGQDQTGGYLGRPVPTKDYWPGLGAFEVGSRAEGWPPLVLPEERDHAPAAHPHVSIWLSLRVTECVSTE